MKDSVNSAGVGNSQDHGASTPDHPNKTYITSNKEFLETVFESIPQDARPFLVSFKGNPGTVPSYSWNAKPWDLGALELPSDANNYYSLSAFRADETGKYKRKKTSFMGLYVVMLDDIGGKISFDKLTLPPSYLLETSSGNYQAGYLLVEPIQSAKDADSLIKAVIDAGLCDPGASGPATRLARLPIGMNGKRDPQFSCYLEEWHPERRYTVAELVDGLKLEMAPADNKKKKDKCDSKKRSDGDGLVFTPRAEENVVIKALRLRSLYKASLGDGKHDITCPWHTEHTGAVDGGSAYFEPEENYPIGGFHCFHGHCAQRNISDLLDNLGISTTAARMKPTIRIIAGEIHRIADVAERELAASGKYYQRGNLLVTVHTDPGTKETYVMDISQSSLVSALSGIAIWERNDGRTNRWQRVDPPQRHVGVIYDSQEYAHMPVLMGLARQPHLRPDGSLVTKAGYDSATRMFGVFDEGQFNIPAEPTMDDAKASLSLLEGLLEEFAFASPADKAAALSGLLTAAVRSSLPLAPMYHVKAAVIGSGKSFLCRIISAFATSQYGAASSFPKDDEECRKMLLADLLKSPAVIEFDNLTGDLVPHKSLCVALTSGYYNGRILGASKMATVSTRTLFLSSGNNVDPVGDMARRCITITLDPRCEAPATRVFKNPNLLSDLLRNRSLYVSAALIVIRAWIVAGCLKSECRSLANYGEWSDWCRQSLLWLGLQDPAESAFQAMVEDPDRYKLGRLLKLLHVRFGTRPIAIRDLVNRASEDQELREILEDISLEPTGINRLRLGRWIKGHANQTVDNLRFVSAGGSRSAQAWQVVSV